MASLCFSSALTSKSFQPSKIESFLLESEYLPGVCIDFNVMLDFPRTELVEYNSTWIIPYSRSFCFNK